MNCQLCALNDRTIPYSLPWFSSHYFLLMPVDQNTKVMNS